MSGIVTLTTDFGSRDPFAAIMKGVMLSIRPELNFIDVTHSITPYDTMQAALCVSRFRNYFPKGTVHVVVVDPGVGSKREGIIIQTERYFYVGPNNGLFSRLDSDIERAVKIENPKYFSRPVSATFHGRDIFAPVAAHLTRTDIGKFGPDIGKPERLYIPEPVLEDDAISGQVIGFDRFGNALTNITEELINEMKEKSIKTEFHHTIIG
ncbi:MAG: S-adenosyl-l-methionine hydroxide adenosyltransferase family protein, partial [Nitrospinota bacterium]